MQALPVKFRIFQIISQQEGVSNVDLYKILKDEYPNDRHVTPHGVENYLTSLKAVGLIRPSVSRMSDAGNIIQEFQITEHGVHKLKYIS